MAAAAAAAAQSSSTFFCRRPFSKKGHLDNRVGEVHLLQDNRVLLHAQRLSRGRVLFFFSRFRGLNSICTVRLVRPSVRGPSQAFRYCQKSAQPELQCGYICKRGENNNSFKFNAKYNFKYSFKLNVNLNMNLDVWGDVNFNFKFNVKFNLTFNDSSMSSWPSNRRQT